VAAYPSAEILDSFLTGAAARTEHYEIAAYEGMIAPARATGTEVASLLMRTLRMRRRRSRKPKAIGKRLAQNGAKRPPDSWRPVGELGRAHLPT
jgi:ferritin-like metal-binding protein YciE